MTIWLIEPRDPLIVRDGRPFNPDPGARAISLPFPLPSTTTGALRTQAGLDHHGHFDSQKSEEVKQISVRGPLLVEMKDNDEIEWLVPAPADALLIERNKEAIGPVNRYWLQPRSQHEVEMTDLGVVNPDLLLVRPHRSDPNKPSKRAPAFWHYNKFYEWLVDPSEERPVDPGELGHGGPQRESRMHVQMQPGQRAAEQSMLFETSGLEFTFHKEQRKLGEARRLALAVDTDAPLQETIACMGGERRMVVWRPTGQEFIKYPRKMYEAIVEHQYCRVILLTPAYFEQGWRPKWLLEPRHNVTPTLKAVAVQRPQVMSGWDLEKRQPKLSRRLVPAGSVFFLSLEGDADAIKRWIEIIWMHCISDTEQDRLDSFGLAVVGTWDGPPDNHNTT